MTARLTPGTAPRLYFHVTDASDDPKTDLVFGDVSSAAYHLITDGQKGGANTISVSSGVAETAAHSSGQFVTIKAADGWYAIDAPSGATNSTAQHVELAVSLSDGTLKVYPSRHPIDAATSTRATPTNVTDAQTSIESGITNVQSAVDALAGPAAGGPVERSLDDQKAIMFAWPVSGATITGEVSKDQASYVAVTGAISFLRTESGRHYYSLAYHADDRPAAEGVARYKLTDGTYTRYVNLRVESASISGDVTLAAIQPNYAPAKAGDQMALTEAQVTALVIAIVAGVEAEIADDATGLAVKQAIIDKLLENLPDLDDLTLSAIATASRDAILNRVLSGNHDTAGTVGRVLQHLNADITSRLASGNVTVGGYATGQSPADLVTGFSTHSVGDVRTELAPELALIDVAISTRLASGNVTVGGYAAGQSPADLVSVPSAATVATQVDVVLTAAHGSGSWTTGAGGGGGSTTISQADINSIVAGVTASTPRIKAAAADAYTMISGDTWTQAISIASADRFVVSIKAMSSDDDADSILLASSDNGLEIINGADASASSTRATVVHSSGVLTITVHSDQTLLLPVGDYLLTVKALSTGVDASRVNVASLSIVRSGVKEVTT